MPRSLRTLQTALLVLALMSCTLTTGPGLSAQVPPLRLVSTAWPPFTNEPGLPRFALDLVEVALSRIEVQSKTTIVAPPEFTSSLLSSLFDGSAAAWKDRERERLLIFSEPYLENRLILVGRRGDNVSASSLDTLNGKRIAIVQGYSYGDQVESAGPTFLRTGKDEDSLTYLLSGKTDFALMDELVVRYITSTYPQEAQSRLQIGTTPLVTRPLHFVIRRDFPNAASLVERFNAQLRQLITDRTYHRLLHVDWIQADVNGDGVTELVPRSDRVGTAAPPRAYSLSTYRPPPSPQSPSKPGFYVGGNLYTDWASVPGRYKVPDPDRPDPSRSAASIFTFRW